MMMRPRVSTRLRRIIAKGAIPIVDGTIVGLTLVVRVFAVVVLKLLCLTVLQ
jgi:hypothetical protein